MTDNQKKLLHVLKEMFQFDQADLDFGIYRIMGMKREEIGNFIEEDLPAQITEGLQELVGLDVAAKIKEIDKQIADTKVSLLPDSLKRMNIDEYEKQKKLLAGSVDIDTVEADIYSHLNNFFSRYYDEGDFISQRRYKDDAYAIPYEGEEIKLHWANADQYYVKTSEHFRNYTFETAYNDSVHFKLVEAESERDNNAAKEKRFFQLHAKNPFEIVDGALLIYMEYKTGSKKKQEDYISDMISAFAAQSKKYPDFSVLLSASGGEKAPLEKHLNRYTARNTFDYFIHKDLGRFLRRELDFFIKNDVIFLDDIDGQEEAKAKEYLAKARIIRKTAGKIIAFLAQIEDFQKKLYLKRKFVVETNYCVTLDRVPEEMYPEIVKIDAQREEWVSRLAINEIEAKLDGPAYSAPLTVDFLKANPFLVLDTAFFSSDFKERLIAGMEDLDDSLDGLMIHSENLQAIHLLRTSMTDKIKCIYLDPPYNTSEETFKYKNNYKHSSWAAMMESRVRSAYLLLSDDGVLMVAIDDEEVYELKKILDTIFGDDSYIGTLVIQSNPRGRGINSFYATCHDYCLCYARNPELVDIIASDLTEKQAGDFAHGNGKASYRLLPFRRSGGYSTPDERPNSEFPLFFDEHKTLFAVGGSRTTDASEPYASDTVYLLDASDEPVPFPMEDFLRKYPKAVRVMPIDTNGSRRVWRWSDRKNILQYGKRGDFLLQQDENKYYIQLKDYIKPGRKPKTLWYDSLYDASSHGTNLLKAILGERAAFGYPKSLYATKDCIHSIIGRNEPSVCLDFFAGSGTTAHAVIDLNRKDNGKRKYILVEMGEYFDAVTRHRVEKIIYSESWKAGKPVSRKGSSHAFKYLRLESYEDTLNNIELAGSERNLLGAAFEGYMLSYMLDAEATGGSMLLLDKLDKPFGYAMDITGSPKGKRCSVDLVETFHYLIGLHVKRSHALTSFDADFSTGKYGAVTAVLKEGDTYKIKAVDGTLPDSGRALVLWREMSGDIVKDNAVLDAFFLRLKDRREYRKIFVNRDNNLQNLRAESESWQVVLIDEEMKKRMFEGV